MEKVTVSGVEPAAVGEESTRRGLSEPLATTGCSLNHYRIAPGDGLPGGLHAHMDQEEVFVVLEGTVSFETTSDPAVDPETVAVGPREAVRFGRGEYQMGYNAGDEGAVVLALGAPEESTQGRVPRTCSDCGDSEYQDTVVVDEQLRVQCPSCEAIHDSGLH